MNVNILNVFKNFCVFGILAVITVVVYSNSLYVPFQFDDIGYICRNVEIHNIKNLSGIWHIYSDPTRFISLLSFALNYHFHQLNVFGFHVVNLGIHALNGFLIWIFVLLLSRTPFLREKNEHPKEQWELIAWITAIVFLVHPIQTQAVTYITQRMTSLATFFYLLSVISYLKSKEGKAVWLIVAIISAIVGMFSKEITFTIPIMIVLIEIFFFKTRMNLKFFLGFVFLLFLIPALHRFELVRVFGVTLPSGSHDGDFIDSGNYALTQLKVIGVYLKLLFWPVNLNLDYDFPLSHSIFELMTFTSGAVLLFLFVLSACLYRRNRLMSFCIVWFFLTLIVESSFIPIRHVIFEHRVYLPSVGFCLLVAILLNRYIKNFSFLIFFTGFILVLLSSLTFERNKIWQSEISLWTDVAKKSPKKARGFVNLGYAYFINGKTSEALLNLSKAAELNPRDGQIFNTRGLVYKVMGNSNLAMADFNKAIEVDPYFSMAYTNRGHLFRLLGDNQRAEIDYLKALEINSYDAQALNNLAVLAILSFDQNKALLLLNKAIEYNPEFDEAYNNRSMVYRIMGENEKSLIDANQSLLLNPQNGSAFINRAQIFESRGEHQKALADLQQAQIIGVKVDQIFYDHVKSRVEEINHREILKSNNL